MENKNSSKGFIALLIVIIILLSALCVLFVTGTISFKSETVNNTSNSQSTESTDNSSTIVNNTQERNYEEGYDSYLKFKVDNESKTNNCNNISANNYYSYTESYVIIVTNLVINNNNYTFRYATDFDNKAIKVYLNDSVVFEGKKSDSLLLDVCNYGNYIVYSVGWEGPPYYRIVDTEGKIQMSFTGRNVTYSNGRLNVEELNKNDIDNYDDNELIKYQLDMNSDNLQKLNITTEKYECALSGSGYDC